MPKTVKYVRQMLETLEEKRKQSQVREGDDATFYEEVYKNDVMMSLKRDPEKGEEVIHVFRFGALVLTVKRELSKQYTGANREVILHPGAFSNSDRDCIWNVLDELNVYQIKTVTAREGGIQIHHVVHDATGKGTYDRVAECIEGAYTIKL